MGGFSASFAGSSSKTAALSCAPGFSRAHGRDRNAAPSGCGFSFCRPGSRNGRPHKSAHAAANRAANRRSTASDRAGWRLVWNTNRNYNLTAGAMFRGRFADVSSALVRAFARARPAPIATFYKGNRVLVIETMEDENAYE